MTYTVTIAAGQKNVVLPNRIRYQAGQTVPLSDDEYGQLSANAVAALFSSVTYSGAAVSHTVTIAAGLKNVVLPNQLRYDGGAVVTLSDAEYAQINPGSRASLFSADIANVSATTESSSAASVATSGTIATTGLGVSRVTTAGAVTGVILQPGTIAGQQVTVVNESANTITFAVAGTSNVADGVADVIAASTARAFAWDAGTSLWYRLG